jgi:hypothetical protein
MNIEQVKEKLAHIAGRKVVTDNEDFVIFDRFGSNVDDAYYGGKSDGATELAHDVLGWLNSLDKSPSQP